MLKSGFSCNDRLYVVKEGHTLIYGQGFLSVETSTDIADIKKTYRPLRLLSAKTAGEWGRKIFGVHGY